VQERQLQLDATRLQSLKVSDGECAHHRAYQMEEYYTMWSTVEAIDTQVAEALCRSLLHHYRID